MPWVELFTVFLVCHLVGDFVLQTEWQARCKSHGLGSDSRARRALFTHVSTYTLAFLPAFAWIADDVGVGDAILAAVLVFVPHLLQDDGRVVRAYITGVKRTDPAATPGVAVAVDQSFHLVALLLLALLIGQ